MRKVSVIARIFPKDPSKINEIEKELREKLNVADSRVEEIGFGVKILKVALILPDSETNYEEKIKSIKEVDEVQIEDVSLI